MTDDDDRVYTPPATTSPPPAPAVPPGYVALAPAAVVAVARAVLAYPGTLDLTTRTVLSELVYAAAAAAPTNTALADLKASVEAPGVAQLVDGAASWRESARQVVAAHPSAAVRERAMRFVNAIGDVGAYAADLGRRLGPIPDTVSAALVGHMRALYDSAIDTIESPADRADRATESPFDRIVSAIGTESSAVDAWISAAIPTQRVEP